jgi:superfamily II DNA or RNA helicase
LQVWIDADYLGTVVLPTGAGKTFLALKAIERVGRSTLIIVPTIDLLNQSTGGDGCGKYGHTSTGDHNTAFVHHSDFTCLSIFWPTLILCLLA